MYCKECGKEYDNKNGEYCLSCGVKKENGNKFCDNCGTEKKSVNQDICLSCGNLFNKNNDMYLSDDNSPKLRLVSLILVIFFGLLGAHRFYVGKYKSAIAILLTYPIMGAISTIITILYNMSDMSSRAIITFLTGLGFFIVPIVLFIDFIMILSGTFKDKDGKVVYKWS